MDLAAATLLAALGSAACGRSSQQGAPAAGSSSVTPSASALAAPISPSTASPAARAGALRAWKGTYKTIPAALSVTADWSKTHWGSADTTSGVGEGTLALSIDPGTGRVTGSLDGAAGPAVIEGTASATQVTASVLRKDPADRGLAGTLVATQAPGAITGIMTLATGDGAVLRAGTFSLAPAARQE